MDEFGKTDVLNVKRLRTREYRDKTGCVIVEGYTEVTRALEAEVPFERMYICPEILGKQFQEFQGISFVEVTKDEFEKIAFGSRLKGILGIFKPDKIQLKDLTLTGNPLILVVESVEKPGNLGTIIRSSDGAGVSCVINCDARTDVHNQHVVRSSIGTVFSIPVIEATKEEVVSFLRNNNISIYAASAHGKCVYYECDFSRPTAIVIGNEHEGVSSYIIENADETISIPMVGANSSLNAGMSASILSYEVARQRQDVG